MKLIKYLLNLIKTQPLNIWVDQSYNTYGICIEQKCVLTGQFRHHKWEDIRGFKILWKPGKFNA